MQINYFIVSGSEQLLETTDKEQILDWLLLKNIDDYSIAMHWQDADEVYFDAELPAREWMEEELRKEILLALENVNIVDD